MGKLTELEPGYYVVHETKEERVARYNITEGQVDELLSHIPSQSIRELIKERYLESLRPSVIERIVSSLRSRLTRPR